MSIVNGISRIGYMKGGGKALWKDENLADSIVSHAIRFFERADGQPFFMYLCTNDVHVPRFPNQRFRGKSPMGLRGEAIMQFDWTIGQILDALKRLNMADNTLIILTSDNGPVLDDGYADQAAQLVGDHKPGGPFRGGKYSAFEAGTTVPFIVSWPGHVPTGKVSDAMVSHIDDIASLSALVGATIPAKGAPDSRQQLDTWLGKSNKSCPWIIEMAANRSLSLRMGKWKYIEPSNGRKLMKLENIETGYDKQPQLYNLKKDRGELVNVYNENPKIAAKLQQLLKESTKPLAQ
jgi:arylsulfatase A-like enzyme